MTEEQYKVFREDFPSIVWWKGQVSGKRKRISQLYAWDKNDSHKIAIEKATADWKEAKNILSDKLAKYNCTYEQLKEHSKNLSGIVERRKRNQQALDKYKEPPLKLRQTKEKIQKEFEEYQIK